MPSCSDLVFNCGPGRVFYRAKTRGRCHVARSLTVVGVPGAALFHDLGRHAHVDDLAFAADAFAEQECRTRRLEQGLTFVLTTFFGLVADGVVALLMVPVRRISQAHAGVEPASVTAGGGSGLLNITPIFMRDLVDEDDHAVGFLMVAVSLRSAWLIRRRLQAGSASPISPSISALG